MISCPNCGTSYPPSVRMCPRDGTVLEGARPTEERFVGAVLHGKYRLDSYLSSGGMGAVFRATHVMLGKPVAVKLIKADLVTSPDMVRRFQREARAATNLNHPSIVGVYDLGQTDDGTLYIAMELVDGKSLKDVIREAGAVPPPRVLSIMRQVASALALAHKNQIIHRDLKPQNVMLTTGPDGRELAKLLDFGIAKTFDDQATQLTQAGFALGTPQYMSPEQAMGKEVDARSDIYSLGVMVYEMLTGDLPFTDPSAPAILLKHMTEAPQPPSQRRPDLGIPPHYEAVVLKCLEKDPGKRFQSAVEFAAALEPGAGTDATVALPMPLGADAATVFMAPDGIPAAPTQTYSPPAAPMTAGTAGTVQPTQGVQPGSTQPARVPTQQTAVPSPHVTAAAPASTPGTQAAPAVSPAQTSATAAAALAAPASPPPPPSVAAAHGDTRGTVPAAAVAAANAASTGRKLSPLALVAGIILLAGAAGGAWFLTQPKGEGANPTQLSSTGAPEASPTSALPPAAPPQTPAQQPAGDQPSTPAGGGSAGSSSTAAAVTGAAAAVERTRETAANAPAEIKKPEPSGNAPAGSKKPAPPPAPAPPAAPAAQPVLPDDPAVFVGCEGPREVCGALRTAFDSSLQNERLPIARSSDRADVLVQIEVTELDRRTDQQFGQTMVTRTYSVSLVGDAPKVDRAVPLPSAQTFSFDAKYGERLNQEARKIAIAAAGRIRQFAEAK